MFFLALSHRESLIPFNKPLLSNYNVLSAYSIIKRSLSKAAFCLPQWGFQKICKMFPGLQMNIKEAGLQGAISWQNVKGALSLDSQPSPLRNQGLFLGTARKLPDIFYKQPSLGVTIQYLKMQRAGSEQPSFRNRAGGVGRDGEDTQ